MSVIRIYLPYGGNQPLLRDCLKSIVDELSSKYTFIIYVLNDSGEKIDFKYIGRSTSGLFIESFCIVLEPTVKLVHSQMLNWILKLAKDVDDDWAIGFHTDAYLYPGGFEILLNGILKAMSENNVALVDTGAFMLLYAINMKFIKQENWEWEPQLFPMYFEDNHFHSFIKSCGWKVLQTEKYNVAAFHHGSHVIRDNPIRGRINSIVFPKLKEIYREIWGGDPGHETKIGDKTAGGTR